MQSDPAEDAGGFDTLADLMLGLVAVVLLAVIILVPLADFAGKAKPAHHARLMREINEIPMTLNGREAISFVATRTGLLLSDGSGKRFGNRAVIDGPELGALLDRLHNTGKAVLLFIEPGGHDSAFHFESRLAREGHTEFAMVRVDPRCRFASEVSAARYCSQEQR